MVALYERENVAIQGDANTYSRGSDSGFVVSFHFCPLCGATVYWEPARRPGLVGVAVGSFADPHFPEPSQTVFEDFQHPWLSFQLGHAPKLSDDA